MTNYSWAGTSSSNPNGDWNTAADWAPAGIPGANDTVTLGPPLDDPVPTVTYTVTDGLDTTIGGFDSDVGDNLSLIDDSVFTLAGPQQSGSSTSNNLSGNLLIGDGSSFVLDNFLNLGIAADDPRSQGYPGYPPIPPGVQGTIELNAESSVTSLVVEGNQSLLGDGFILLSDNADNEITGAAAGSTLTLDKPAILGAGLIGGGNLAIVNASAIDAIDATPLVIDLANVTNMGRLGAGLYVGQPTTTNSSGTLVIEQSSITNVGGTLIASAGSQIVLDNSSITNGQLSGSIIVTGTGTAGESSFIGSGPYGLTNTGTVTVTNGAALSLSDTIYNIGTIALDGTGSTTSLIIDGNVTLGGGGTVAMSGSALDEIVSNGAPATLTDASIIITGGGTIGDADLSLVNSHGNTIVANSTTAPLYLSTGSNAVNNAGILAATGGALLVIGPSSGSATGSEGSVVNNGTIWANGGGVTIDGSVSGTGLEKITGAALEFGGGVAAGQIVEFTGALGGLKLDSASTNPFLGTIIGFDQAPGADNHIDIRDIQYFQNPTATWTENSTDTGGTLALTGGGHTVDLTLLGQYASGTYTTASTSGFVLSPDHEGVIGHGGTLISYVAPVT